MFVQKVQPLLDGIPQHGEGLLIALRVPNLPVVPVREQAALEGIAPQGEVARRGIPQLREPLLEERLDVGVGQAALPQLAVPGYHPLYKVPVLEQTVEPVVLYHLKLIGLTAKPAVVVKAVVEVPDAQLELSSQLLIHIGGQAAGVPVHGKLVEDEVLRKGIYIDIGRVPQLGVVEGAAVQGLLKLADILGNPGKLCLGQLAAPRVADAQLLVGIARSLAIGVQDVVLCAHPVPLDDIGGGPGYQAELAQAQPGGAVGDRLHRQVDPLICPVHKYLTEGAAGGPLHDLPGQIVHQVVSQEGAVQEGAVEHPLAVRPQAAQGVVQLGLPVVLVKFQAVLGLVKTSVRGGAPVFEGGGQHLGGGGEDVVFPRGVVQHRHIHPGDGFLLELLPSCVDHQHRQLGGEGLQAQGGQLLQVGGEGLLQGLFLRLGALRGGKRGEGVLPAHSGRRHQTHRGQNCQTFFHGKVLMPAGGQRPMSSVCSTRFALYTPWVFISFWMMSTEFLALARRSLLPEMPYTSSKLSPEALLTI